MQKHHKAEIKFEVRHADLKFAKMAKGSHGR